MSEGTAALSAPATVASGDNGTGVEPQNTGTDNNESSWTTGFDEDTLGYVKNKGWNDPSELLTSYRNLEKFQGGSKNLIEVPGEDASEDVISNFYDQLGRPGSPEEYGIELPDGGDAELLNWFQEMSHRHGLSSKQAQQIFQDYQEMSSTRIEAMENDFKLQSEQAIEDLKREWGRDYESNLNAGRLAAQGLGYDEQSLSELETKMGTAEMLNLFSKIGSRMGEDTFVDGNTDNGFGTSPAQAQAKINELKNDAQFMQRYMSGDKAATQKMKELMEKAYG
jgi:hypothetical protein